MSKLPMKYIKLPKSPNKRCHHPAVTAMIDSCNSSSNTIKVFNFLLLAKKQNPTNETTYFVKDFSLFAKFPFN